MHLVEVQEALEGVPGVRTVAVMPGTVELLEAVREELELRMPVLSDPGWDLHRRYHMRRGSRRDIYLSLATWKAYARLFRRWKLRRPSEDIFQLGGVAVVDQAGGLAWLHRGRNPADYADPGEVVAVARALMGALEADPPCR